MATFKFALEGYLNVKEKLEEQKMLDYGRSIAALETEKQKKIQLESEKSAQIDTFREHIKTKIDPQAFMNYNDYITLLKGRIVQQQKAIDHATVFAENKRLELVEAMKQRKMITKLKEKEHSAFLRQETIIEQKITDEIVSYRYNIRQQQ